MVGFQERASKEAQAHGWRESEGFAQTGGQGVGVRVRVGFMVKVAVWV